MKVELHQGSDEEKYPYLAIFTGDGAKPDIISPDDIVIISLVMKKHIDSAFEDKHPSRFFPAPMHRS